MDSVRAGRPVPVRCCARPRRRVVRMGGALRSPEPGLADAGVRDRAHDHPGAPASPPAGFCPSGCRSTSRAADVRIRRRNDGEACRRRPRLMRRQNVKRPGTAGPGPLGRVVEGSARYRAMPTSWNLPSLTIISTMTPATSPASSNSWEAGGALVVHVLAGLDELGRLAPFAGQDHLAGGTRHLAQRRAQPGALRLAVLLDGESEQECRVVCLHRERCVGVEPRRLGRHLELVGPRDLRGAGPGRDHAFEAVAADGLDEGIATIPSPPTNRPKSPAFQRLAV